MKVGDTVEPIDEEIDPFVIANIIRNDYGADAPQGWILEGQCGENVDPSMVQLLEQQGPRRSAKYCKVCSNHYRSDECVIQ